MTLNVYQRFAMRTSNPDLTPFEHLENGILGLNGEAGEASDLLKKYKFQGHPLDEDRIIKELGDCLWYLAEAATGLGINLSWIAEENKKKLEARYPNGFDPERSIHRAEGDV